MSEIASAYVSLIPSFRGGTASIRDQIGPPAAKAGEQAGQGMGKSMLSGLAKLGIGGAVAGIFAGAISNSANRAKLTASLGLNPTEAKTAASVAGRLYAGAFADNLDEANDAIRFVSQNLTGVGNGKQLEGLSKRALSLSQAFGTDLAGNVNAAAQLIRNGLAKNAEQAFDIIATGEQNGADKAGDLLDTFNEYGTQFRKLGLDGPRALGLISQGLQAGARDSDKVADALKEFSIRAVDGSKLTAQGFSAIGLNAKAMQTAIAAGGPSAAKALDLTLTKLRGIADPAKRSQAAVALFGTQSEDLGDALYALDPATALAAKGMSHLDGASARVTTAMGKTTPPLEAFKRQVVGVFTQIGAYAVPILAPFLSLISSIGRPLAVAGVAAVSLVAAFKAFQAVRAWTTAAIGAGKSAVAFVKGVRALTIAMRANYVWTARSKAQLIAARVVTLAMSAATKVWAGTQWLLNAAMRANPLALVITALVAIGVALVIAYKKSETFRRIVAGAFGVVRAVVGAVAGFFTGTLPRAFNAVVDGLRSAFDGVVGFLKTWGPRALVVLVPFVGIPLLIYRNFDRIRGWISGVFTSVVGFLKGVGAKALGALSALLGLPGRIFGAFRQIPGWLGSVWSKATSGITGFVRTIVGAVTGIPGKIASVAGKMLDAGGRLMRGLFDGIKKGLTSAGSFALDLGKTIVNAIIGAINGFLHLPLKLPRITIYNPIPGADDFHIGGQTLLPSIPKLAKGGIVPATAGGRIVQVAEAGHAEAVIPLDRAGEFGLGKGGDTHVTVHQASDPIATARAVTRRLAFMGGA